VVYISLPNSLHVDWTVRALESGKNVLCETPLGRRAVEVSTAFDVAEREGRLLMEAYTYRHNPQTHRLTELTDQSAVGRVRLVRAALVRAAFSFVPSHQANFRLSAALDGGTLMDFGCYCVNGARLIAGEPERVNAEQVIGGDGVDIEFTATMHFAGDVLAQCHAGLAAAARQELEVVGDQGSLLLDDPWRCRRPGIEIRRSDGVERIEIEPVDSYGLEAENMSAAVRGEEPLLLSRDDAIGQPRDRGAVRISGHRACRRAQPKPAYTGWQAPDQSRRSAGQRQRGRPTPQISLVIRSPPLKTSPTEAEIPTTGDCEVGCIQSRSRVRGRESAAS
jgi:xylose dehydrogenase (NAD/NADP)